MLHFIRERAKGFFAWLIFILIVIPFAFWGINSYFEGGGDVSVAKVNDEEIPVQEFQRLLLQERAFRKQLLGDNADPALLDDVLIKRSVLERLVNTTAVAQAAEAAGFRISDAQLRAHIIGNPQFQRDGRFDPQLYARILNSLGMREQAYEAELRRDLLVEQLIGSISDTAFVTPQELDGALRLQYQQRRIAYLVLKADDYLSDEPVADDEVEAYYESHLDRYVIPEQVRVAYLEIAATDLMAGITVDEDTLRKMYEAQRSEFMVPEERRASHILIAVEEGADEAAEAAARQKAEEILQRLKKGEPFEKLAKEFSDDPGSAANGGDLGYFGKGVMVKAFEEKAFAMKVGEISGPVRSRFGYHIIKLTDIRPAHGRDFEEVRATLEQEYRQQKAEEIFFDLTDRLTDLAYEVPDTLEVAAQELGLTIKVSDFFSREQGSGIAADPKVRAAAFSPDVLEAGNNSEPITIAPDHVVVLRVKDHRPLSHRPLDEVRGEIEQALRLQRARERAAEAGEALLQRIRGGEAPEAVAKDAGVQWLTPGFVGRQAQSLPRDIIRHVFTLAHPGQTPVFSGKPLSGGDFAVIGLYEVKDGDVAAIAEEERKQWRQRMLRDMGRRESDAILEAIKQRSEIEIHQENM